jgi:hypothetical protein
MRGDQNKIELAKALTAITLFFTSFKALSEEVDLSKLPRAASEKIDFSRQIRPILEKNCYKCHGDEKPKSHFRLTSREAALKGGEHGVDIVPANSAKSPLIHYVARLVPDMEMPPEGRGAPLSSNEVALLRAWIDQGVTWEPTAQQQNTELILAPGFQWTGVSGDTKKFQELYWQHDGWLLGMEDFELTTKPGPDSRITSFGHAYRDDYLFVIKAEKNDLGFSQFGWSQYRKYYDDTGGYYALFTPPAFSLDRDLYVDVGKGWVDFGLTLPRWPVITVGYEYQFRRGTEATLQWGPVTQGVETRDIYPAFKDLLENVHILKFDVNYEVAGVLLNDSFRGEWYRLNTQENNDSGFVIGGGGMALTQASEQQRYFQGANAFHVEKQFTDWLIGSGGYLYSKLNADGTMDVETANLAFLNTTVGGAPGWQANPIQLERESHVFSLSARLGPWEGLSLSLGTQNEWTREMGLGAANVNIAVPFAPFIFPVQPEMVNSDWDRRIFSQNVGLLFTKIPFTTLFAEARFAEEDTGQFEEEDGGLTPYLRETDVESNLRDVRVGFNTSPWRRVSLSGDYRRYDHNTDYNNYVKESLGQPFEGYPAFITQRDLLSNEAQAKLAFQWAAWLKTSLTYQWIENHYRTTTDPVSDPVTGLAGGISPGGNLLAGTYDSQSASLNATLTPWRRLFISATLAYQHDRTVTAANGDPSVAPYAGDVYSLILSGNYALNAKTDLMATYAFSTADFSQDNLAAGLPLGINYHQHTLQAGIRRQIAKGTTINVQYRFYLYKEPSSGTINNFEGNGVFGMLTLRLP